MFRWRPIPTGNTSDIEWPLGNPLLRFIVTYILFVSIVVRAVIYCYSVICKLFMRSVIYVLKSHTDNLQPHLIFQIDLCDCIFVSDNWLMEYSVHWLRQCNSTLKKIDKQPYWDGFKHNGILRTFKKSPLSQFQRSFAGIDIMKTVLNWRREDSAG